MSETALQQKIVKALRARGAWARKFHSGPYQGAGIPDIACVYKGVAVWLEVKLPNKKPTLIQIHELQELMLAGAVAGVVSSVADALRFLSYVDTKKEFC